MVAVALTVSGCTALQADLNTTVTVGSVAAPTTLPSSTTSTTPGRDCSPLPWAAGPAARIAPVEPGGASISIARTVFSCAEAVVVTAGNDLALVAVSAQLAAALGGPLLIVANANNAEVEAELERLGPGRVTLVGDLPPLGLPVGAAVENFDRAEEVAAAADEALEADIRVSLPSGGVAAAARILEPIATGGSVWLPASGPVATCDRDDDDFAEAITRRARAAKPQAALWLVDVCAPEVALVAAAAARHAGGTVLLVDGRDLWKNRALVDALPGTSDPDRVVLLGEVAPDVDWQIGALLADNELPGGGLTLFPDRRIVALYGNPTTPALGVMGEQGPEQAAERAREVAAPYASGRSRNTARL